MSEKKAWIGVDLDGTVAEYHGFKGATTIGPPIPLMVDRIRKWLATGMDVKIFTARVSQDDSGEVVSAIQDWCFTHIGARLEVTNIKDYQMVKLWDDRAVQVMENTGITLQEHLAMADPSNLPTKEEFLKLLSRYSSDVRKILKYNPDNGNEVVILLEMAIKDIWLNDRKPDNEEDFRIIRDQYSNHMNLGKFLFKD